jgi:hypothetical protein
VQIDRRCSSPARDWAQTNRATPRHCANPPARNFGIVAHAAGLGDAFEFLLSGVWSSIVPIRIPPTIRFGAAEQVLYRVWRLRRGSGSVSRLIRDRVAQHIAEQGSAGDGGAHPPGRKVARRLLRQRRGRSHGASDHIFLRFSTGGFQRSQLLLSKRQSRESQDMLATVGLEPIPGYCRKSTWRWVFPWIASRTSRISAWHTSWVDSFT